MKTDKFNRMIEAFECDFSLIKEGRRTFASLDKVMKDSRYSLSEDMELMQELSTMLRYGQAEIHLTEKPKTNADRIRNFSDEELAEWLHNICQFENSEHFPMISIYNLDTKCEEEIGDNYKDLIEWLQAEVKEGAENDR